jgi:acetyl esterase
MSKPILEPAAQAFADAGQGTGGYREFADGPYLTAKAMAWFWDAYLPEKDKRDEITASAS